MKQIAQVRPRPIRVLVVDDHEVVRAGLVRLLERAGIVVVGALPSGEQALEALEGVSPDVVILDYRLPEMTGAEACERILRLRPGIAVVILTGGACDEVIRACIQAGARGFLTKEIDNGDLAEAVRAVARGEPVLSPEVTERLMSWAACPEAAHDPRTLNAREIEVLALVAQGLSNREIGRSVCVSEHTAKATLKSAMRKLGASRRLEAVAAGMERGVI